MVVVVTALIVMAMVVMVGKLVNVVKGLDAPLLVTVVNNAGYGDEWWCYWVCYCKGNSYHENTMSTTATTRHLGLISQSICMNPNEKNPQNF